MWLCGNDPFDEVRHLGDLLTLEQLTSGGGRSPSFCVRIHWFHCRQLAVATEERGLIQHFLEEIVLVADVSMWREALLQAVQDHDDGAKAAELKRGSELDQVRLRQTGQPGGTRGICPIDRLVWQAIKDGLLFLEFDEASCLVEREILGCPAVVEDDQVVVGTPEHLLEVGVCASPCKKGPGQTASCQAPIFNMSFGT